MDLTPGVRRSPRKHKAPPPPPRLRRPSKQQKLVPLQHHGGPENTGSTGQTAVVDVQDSFDSHVDPSLDLIAAGLPFGDIDSSITDASTSPLDVRGPPNTPVDHTPSGETTQTLATPAFTFPPAHSRNECIATVVAHPHNTANIVEGNVRPTPALPRGADPSPTHVVLHCECGAAHVRMQEDGDSHTIHVTLPAGRISAAPKLNLKLVFAASTRTENSSRD
ncbi:hypothetical protein AURDEDRAFT_169292 [Auricularia subglabra TFB-10046 SS5]|nr:hypothetical protein AURDEDRAFT_169292 [Auricularia subglabra TFB-10046 SS5]